VAPAYDLRGQLFRQLRSELRIEKASFMGASPIGFRRLYNCVTLSPRIFKEFLCILKDHSSAVLYDYVRVPTCQRLQGEPWRWRWLGESLCHVAPALASDWVDLQPLQGAVISQNSTNSVFCDGTWVKLFA
jgi:hypothetical protein